MWSLVAIRIETHHERYWQRRYMTGIKRYIKVLIAKPGLDGHDRGANVIALGLRDEGMEVIYTGIRQTPESIVETCIQEDVDVVGLSCLSGAHMYHFPKVAELLAEKGMGHILIIGGGNIPEEDTQTLRNKGIKAIFGRGTSVKDVAKFIRDNLS
jgi:methylmalonyl-CoA mutase, C-terminal domain